MCITLYTMALTVQLEDGQRRLFRILDDRLAHDYNAPKMYIDQILRSFGQREPQTLGCSSKVPRRRIFQQT